MQRSKDIAFKEYRVDFHLQIISIVLSPFNCNIDLLPSFFTPLNTTPCRSTAGPPPWSRLWRRRTRARRRPLPPRCCSTTRSTASRGGGTQAHSQTLHSRDNIPWYDICKSSNSFIRGVKILFGSLVFKYEVLCIKYVRSGRGPKISQFCRQTIVKLGTKGSKTQNFCGRTLWRAPDEFH